MESRLNGRVTRQAYAHAISRVPHVGRLRGAVPMKPAPGIALIVAAGLAFAGASQAKTTHAAKCRAGYVRRSVQVPERKHGRIVRHHGKIVYMRVQRCVRRGTATRPFPPLGGPIGTGSPSSPFAPVVPTSPFAPVVPTSSAPANSAPPTISGNAAAGSTLTASTGGWTNAPTSYAYQWERCDAGGGSCQNMTGATGSTYTPGSSDVGSTLRVSVTAANGSGSASASSAAAGPVGSTTDPVVVAVGDIACRAGDTTNSCRQLQTATVAQKQNPAQVFVLGDNQYDSGSYSEYTGLGAYGATWGVFNPIVHPVPGNHEYLTSAAAGYFQYFGAVAHAPAGYYSFNVGTWHIVSLNSNCSDQNGCADALPGGTTSAQTSWLQSDLAANREPCVLAMWHHPLFSYGWTLGSPGVQPLWTALYNAHADVVLDGHDHLYERYTQQDPSGNATTTGIREFVVGTGGESLNGLYSSQPPANLQASDSSDFGVLVLTLHANSYSWKFVNTNGATVDSGTTVCHGPGSGALSALARVGGTPAPGLSGPPLVFDARPLHSSLTAVLDRGLAVAVQLSRGADVTVSVSVRRGRNLQRIASFYETESEVPKPYSRILLRLPARRLRGLHDVTLVLQFGAVDSASHRRVLTRTVRVG